EPVGLRTGRRIDTLDPERIEALAKARQIVLVRAERDELQLLARTLHDRAPAMRVAVGIEAEPAALLAEVEAEVRVELAGRLQIRNREVELVERVHAKLAGTAVQRLRQRSDLRHWTPPWGSDGIIASGELREKQQCIAAVDGVALPLRHCNRLVGL